MLADIAVRTDLRVKVLELGIPGMRNSEACSWIWDHQEDLIGDRQTLRSKDNVRGSVASFHDTPGKYAEHSCPLIYLASNAAKCNRQRQHSFKETSTYSREEAPGNLVDKELIESVKYGYFLGTSWALNTGPKSLVKWIALATPARPEAAMLTQEWAQSESTVIVSPRWTAWGFDQPWPLQMHPELLISQSSLFLHLGLRLFQRSNHT